jgi:thiamine transport system ATP-binding protein
MLDEPVGQLDRTLRERLVTELRDLFHDLGTTVLAAHTRVRPSLADRVVVMEGGRVVQSGTVLEVWRHPADAFGACFLRLRQHRPRRCHSEGRGHPPGASPPVPDGTVQGECRLLVPPPVSASSPPRRA